MNDIKGYRAVKNRRKKDKYDVILVVYTPSGKEFTLCKSCLSIRKAREMADIFNKEIGVTI